MVDGRPPPGPCAISNSDDKIKLLKLGGNAQWVGYQVPSVLTRQDAGRWIRTPENQVKDCGPKAKAEDHGVN